MDFILPGILAICVGAFVAVVTTLSHNAMFECADRMKNGGLLQWIAQRIRGAKQPFIMLIVTATFFATIYDWPVNHKLHPETHKVLIRR